MCGICGSVDFLLELLECVQLKFTEKQALVTL